jgi:fumarate hydratase class II
MTEGGSKDDDSDDDAADVALAGGTAVGTTVGAKGGHTSIVRDIMKDQEAEAKKSDNKVLALL